MTARLIENDERRTQARYTGPDVRFEIDGEIYQISNWSLGGCYIENYEGELTSGSVFDITAIGPEKGGMTPVEVRARVMRYDPARRSLAVRFNARNRTAYKLLMDLMPNPDD
ncbi:MAG: PilZ domain-containing protein [Magnetospiraceae bacterium]